MTSLAALSVSELADGICLRAGQIAAAQAELLRWIAEFDRREGWAGPGMLSCAAWLSWRAGMSLGTARDQVRVARRLEELPELAAAFTDGRVSYSKVRAITRVADPDDGIDWIELARHSSAAQLDTLVRGVHRARADEAAERDPDAAAWRLRTRTRYDEHGNFTLTISGPAQLLPVIRAGLDAKKAQLQQHRASTAEPSATPTSPADSTEPLGRAQPPAQADPAVHAEPPAPAEPALSSEPRIGTEPNGGAEPGASPARHADDAPAQRVTPAERSSGPAEDDAAEAALDEQAPGWPAGTTRCQVLAAVDRFAQLQRELGAERAAFPAEPPTSAPPKTDGLVSDARPAAGATPHASAACTHTTPDPRGSTTQPAITDADALLALAQDALHTEQTTRPDVSRRRRPQLTIRIDPLSGWARQADGELLPPSSLRTVLKTLPGHGSRPRLRPVADADLRHLDLGRTAREVSPALRELLGTLDGERCRFPGCTRTHELHAHHIRFWRDGGSTDLDNLVLVCSRHHTLIHTQGFTLVLHPDRRLEVRTAAGTPVLHHPAQPWADPDDLAAGCGQRVSAETLPPDHCDGRLDLHYAVNVLMTQAA